MEDYLLVLKAFDLLSTKRDELFKTAVESEDVESIEKILKFYDIKKLDGREIINLDLLTLSII
jgi:hypothetical protein